MRVLPKAFLSEAKQTHLSLSLSLSLIVLSSSAPALKTHRQSPSQVLSSYACDLTSSASSTSTLSLACAPFSSAPDYIFACAGGSVPGLFTELSADEHWRCMEWNYKTTLGTIHEGVRRMKEEGKRGKVVVTASVLAMMGIVGYSSYCPSKYAIRGTCPSRFARFLLSARGDDGGQADDRRSALTSLTHSLTHHATGLADTLRNELQLYGISVHLFLPATIFSPGFAHEQSLKLDLTKRIEGPDDGMTPEKVAAHLIRGAPHPLAISSFCET
jgi:3-dehydrosphinganine reductase